MPLVEFFVTQRASGWFVDVGAEYHGPYLSCRDAVADAIEAAEAEGRRKKNRTVVLVKEPGADAKVVWTYRKEKVDTADGAETPP